LAEKGLTNLEVFSEKVDIATVFVVMESVLPEVTHLFLKSCPMLEVRNVSGSLLPLDAFDTLLKLFD
jgi:hypothetical protein